MVALRSQCSCGQTLPHSAMLLDLYRCSKRRLGAHLGELPKRGTWSLPECKLHINYLELKMVFWPYKVPRPLPKQIGSWATVYPIMENPDLVLQETSTSQDLTHSRPAKFGSRQAIQARPDHLEWSDLPVVFQMICNKWHQPWVDLFAMRSNKLPQCVSSVLPSLIR